MKLKTISLSLRGKLLLVVVSAFLIGVSLFGTFRIYQSRLNITNEIKRSGQEHAKLIAVSLANMLATNDNKQIESLIEEYIKLQDVQHIRISDRAGKTISSRNNNSDASSDNNITFHAPIIYAGETAGSVELTASLDRINQFVGITYRNVVIAMLIFAILLGTSIYTTVSVFIVKPLTRLSEAADNLAKGDFSTALPPSTKDELGKLVNAFSSMRRSRQNVENELNNINASLENIVMARVAELQGREAYIHAVLDNVDEGIIVLDESGKIISFNLAAEIIFNRTEEEVINQNFNILISSQDAQLTGKHRIFGNASENTIFFGVTREVLGMRKDSGPFPLELKTSQICIQNKLLYIRTARDISESKEAEQRINHIASHDSLTNLPNRTLLQDRIEQTLVHNRRRKQQAAILFIDLDKFKVINDTLGHDFGDAVLQETASRLVAEVRSEDTVARQGGDEFIILLSDISNPEDASHIAQKLIETLLNPYYIQSKELYIGASIGIAVFPDDGEDMSTLLKNSDIAMYHAKETGRGNYQFYSEKMNSQASKKQALTNDLRHAVERKQLLLEYQPVLDMNSNELAGMEVLLRWQHPVEGLIPPDKFIPLAEESGLILQIGDWVCRTTCSQIKLWLDQGYDVPRISLNLTAKQFREKSLADMILSNLNQHGLNPQFIGIEITESMLVQNIEEAAEALRKLNDIGLEISIDDFGTGYSSLSHLKRLPISKLKIDKSFVDNISTHPEDAEILKAVIAMAHGLSMKVVAEGVETKEQLACLRNYGCEQYQGYVYSNPLTNSEAASRLEKT